MQDLAKPPAPPPPFAAGLWLAGAWLLVTTLGCFGSAIYLFTPETLANVAIVTLPLYVSGWGSMLGAYLGRKRVRPQAIAAALIGGGGGLALGVVGLLVAYEILWPGYL